MHNGELPIHVRIFLNVDFYPHPVDAVEMIQTHISWVFLAGEFAYKIKKPVNFGFLDFSTPDQRRYYCEEELRLNRRSTPEIYLDVIGIRAQGEGFALSGEGPVIDYCLKMRRFEQSDLLDVRLRSGAFDAQWMDVLAADISCFHRNEKPVAAEQIDHAAELDKHIRANMVVASRHIGQALSQQTLNTLNDYANSGMVPLAILMKRQSDGFVRHCHGDLHLQNMTLIENRPRLFDCIEFNESFAVIDTFNDIAFLVMDCDARGRSDLGMRFLSRYLEACGDYTGLTLLNHYCFYRACVRGKVACLLAEELSEGEEKQQQYAEARKYFDLAAGYTQPRPPKLMAIGGLSASGKSHLALLGCGEERAIIIRSDATRKRIASDFPELSLYGKQMHVNTYNAMFAAAGQALEAGMSVILDATFLHPDSRQQVKTLAEQYQIPLHFFWLDIDEATLRSRIRQRSDTGDDISDADEQVLDQQLANYQRPQESWVQILNSSNAWPNL